MKALIIDDEEDIRDLISLSLETLNITCDTAKNFSEALSLLGNNTYSFCLTDLNLPDGNGIDIVQFAQNKHPEMPIAVITAYGDMNTAVTAMKAGAFDFIAKPIDLAILRQTAQNALAQINKKPISQQATQNDIGAQQNSVQLLGESESINALKKQIIKVARSLAPIHIHGESGTGKELVAQMIHEHSSRADKPFVPINCGALPSELVESELFGHKKGSFTGAVQDKLGLFKEADGGTLFLDEIAELPILMQVKLLRALQEKKIRPVGSSTEETVDVRILSASHKDLNQCVQDGTFRQDLYYRVNVIELIVPPLRERQTDITLLSQYFIKRIATELMLDTPTISATAINCLNQYAFKGNVRELENILQRAIALCENGVINETDFNLKTEEEGNIKTAIQSNSETEQLKRTLEKNHWNKKATAQEMGISYRQLRYKVEKLKLN